AAHPAADRCAPRAPADCVPAPPPGGPESQESRGRIGNVGERREAPSASRLRGVACRASRSERDAVSAELRAQVLEAAAVEPSPTRAAVRRRNTLMSIVAAVSAIAAFALFAVLMSESHLLRLGGEVSPQQRVERPVWLVVTTAGGALA